MSEWRWAPEADLMSFKVDVSTSVQRFDRKGQNAQRKEINKNCPKVRRITSAISGVAREYCESVLQTTYCEVLKLLTHR